MYFPAEEINAIVNNEKDLSKNGYKYKHITNVNDLVKYGYSYIDPCWIVNQKYIQTPNEDLKLIDKVDTYMRYLCNPKISSRDPNKDHKYRTHLINMSLFRTNAKLSFEVFLFYYHFIQNNSLFRFERYYDKIFDQFNDFNIKPYKKLKEKPPFLLINIFPGAGKSTTLECLAAHMLYTNADRRILYLTHTMRLAQERSQGIKSIFGDKKDILGFNAIYASTNYTLSQNTNSKANWKLAQGSERSGFAARTTGSYLSGEDGGNEGNKNEYGVDGMIICDDLIDTAEAFKSEVKREAVSDKFHASIIERLRGRYSTIIAVEQRMHQDDLTNSIITKLSTQHKINHVVIPAINEDGTLNHTKKTKEQLMALANSDSPLDKFVFYSQYQQAPIAWAGNLFNVSKISSIKTSDFAHEKHNLKHVFLVCDFAYKEKGADYTVACLFGVEYDRREPHRRFELILIDLLRERGCPMDITKKLNNLFINWKDRLWTGSRNLDKISFYIEDTSPDAFRSYIDSKYFNMRVMQRKTQSKVQRAQKILNVFHGGNLLISNECRHVNTLKDEMSKFSSEKGSKGHKHDDIVDCIIDGLNIRLSMR